MSPKPVQPAARLIWFDEIHDEIRYRPAQTAPILVYQFLFQHKMTERTYLVGHRLKPNDDVEYILAAMTKSNRVALVQRGAQQDVEQRLERIINTRLHQIGMMNRKRTARQEKRQAFQEKVDGLFENPIKDHRLYGLF